MEKHWLFRRLCALCVTAFVLCACFGAFAAKETQDEPENAAAPERVVRIGYFRNGPYVKQGADGSVTGYGPDYLARVSEYTGWQCEFVAGTWPELLEMLEKHEIDLVGAVQQEGEQAERLEFCRYASGSEIFYLYGPQEAENLYYNDYAGFDGMRVAVTAESRQDAALEQMQRLHGFACKQVSVLDETEAVRLLQNGQVDGVVSVNADWQNTLKLLSRISAVPVYTVTWKGNTALMEELENALAQILAEDPGFIQTLQARYFKNSLAVSQPAFTREQTRFIRERQPVKVLVMNRPPWSWKDQTTGEARGVTVDILKELGRISGLEFEFAFLPTAASPVANVQAGEYELCAGIMDSELFRRNDALVLSDSYYSETLLALCRKGFSGNLAGALHVELPVGFVAGRAYLQKEYPQYNLGDSITIQECLNEVLAGRADFAVEDSLVIGQLTQNPRYEELTSLPRFEIPENYCAAAQNTPQGRMLISILNESIRCLDEETVSKLVLDNTVSAPSQLTWQDLLHKYRQVLTVAAVLLVLLAGVVCAAFWQRQRHVRQLSCANARLEQVARQAQQATRAKSEFLSRMSHEIRTPLNAIIGFSRLAGEHLTEPAQAENYLQKVQTSSKLLLGIINDVLDMSAIEQGKLKLACESFSMSEVLAAVDSMFAPQCAEKGLEYVSRHPACEAPCVVQGDVLRTQQILLNLLSNAVKFTPQGGRVSLVVEKLPAPQGSVRFRFTVADTGEGMNEEMLRHLFQPFEQEDGTTARRHGGSGLGLSIVKGLVDAMGGDLTVKSAKGEGSRFTLELPFVKAVGAPRAALTAGGAASPPKLVGKRILMAEDNEMNALLAREVLKPTGVQVDWARDGSAALKVFLAAPEGGYQLVLMDIQMPGMNGYETARRLRAQPRPDAPLVPILAMTADAFKEDVEKAMAAGMDGHLAKPIDPAALYKALADHML